jgi:UDP-GlcNAc:undecaprenyl-phosphate GlcNAc-1-phosphate transferase
MGISNLDYFALFVSAFVLVGALTPLMRRIAIKNEVYDSPVQGHKTHKVPVPYLGGVAIIIGTLTVSYGASLVSNFTKQTFWLASSALLPALFLGIIGLIDDLRNLPTWPRFLAQSTAGIFTAILLITTNTVGNPTGSKFFDAAITVFWIVGICNSINFFDNLDGGASGTVAISSLALFILAFNGNQFLIAALSVVIAGSTFGFLLWNKSPARIYMGDAGALFLGILIASLTIRLKPEIESSAASLVIPILLLAVPILDTSVAVISRISRGISPLTGGKDHLSHRLMNCGLTKKNTAYALWTLTLLFSATSILIQKIPNSYFDFVVSLASLFWLFLFLKFIRIKI